MTMQRPYDAETCRTRLIEFSKTENFTPVPPGAKGAILGTLNGVFGSDGKGETAEDAKRHTVLGWLFGDPNQPLKPISSKELTEGQWYALSKWLAVYPVIADPLTGKTKWLPCQDFMTEALFVLNAALRKMYHDEGQMMLQLGYEEESDGS